MRVNQRGKSYNKKKRRRLYNGQKNEDYLKLMVKQRRGLPCLKTQGKVLRNPLEGRIDVKHNSCWGGGEKKRQVE